jgi:hypothetical protein
MGEWVTSGWNWRPHMRVERFWIATNSAFAVDPHFEKPSGTAWSLSPWLRTSEREEQGND